MLSFKSCTCSQVADIPDVGAVEVSERGCETLLAKLVSLSLHTQLQLTGLHYYCHSSCFIQAVAHKYRQLLQPVFFFSYFQTFLQAATYRTTCPAAPLCVKQAKTAATWWPVASVAHILDSTTASVRRDTTARVCSMSAQVGPQRTCGYF